MARNLTEAEAADRLGFKPQTLRKWRYLGRGPAYLQPEGEHAPVRYRERDLDEWEQSQLRVPISV
jgi:hypothetical protein